LASIHGVIWNIRQLKRTLYKRYFVQRYVRKVPDETIIRYMHRPSLVQTAVSLLSQALHGKHDINMTPPGDL
jgi:hypothetical protein